MAAFAAGLFLGILVALLSLAYLMARPMIVRPVRYVRQGER